MMNCEPMCSGTAAANTSGMSTFRLVALLAFVAAAGCYSDAAPQSTFPEPHYISGPPGGAFDPGTAYEQGAGDPGDDAADDSAPDTAAAPSENAPGADATGVAEQAPVSEDGETGEDLADASGDPGDAADPTASVTDAEIGATLDGYGQWIETDDYGPVWRPDATVVGVDFTPYETGGSWAYTDAGWAFSCDYPWGWLPFHYGRWGWFHGYWGWVPGHRWGPAWVQWRHGGGVVGWRPLRPRIRDHRTGDPNAGHRFGSGALVRDHRRAESHSANWRFARVDDFAKPHIRSHLFRNPAEGLRVTTKVTAPPLRAQTTIRAADLMRGRVAAGARLPGRFGGPSQVRDHRSFAPARPTQPPAQAVRPPNRFQPSGPPVRTYQPPQAYRPPANGQPYAPPRNYRPPVYNPPVRSATPPAGNYNPPVRNNPAPVRTYQPPPVRNYSPPAHSSPAPSHASPPARTYSPPPSSSPSPSRSSSPAPSHSSSSSSSSSHSSSSSSSSHSSSSSGGGRHR